MWPQALPHADQDHGCGFGGTRASSSDQWCGGIGWGEATEGILRPRQVGLARSF